MDEKGNGKQLSNRYNSPRGARRRTILYRIENLIKNRNLDTKSHN